MRKLSVLRLKLNGNAVTLTGLTEPLTFQPLSDFTIDWNLLQDLWTHSNTPISITYEDLRVAHD